MNDPIAITLRGKVLNTQILKLCIPSVISNITVPLLGLCDTTVAGHLGSADFLASIAVGTMMFNVIFWLMGFLRMGTTGLTAQALGSGDFTRIRVIFTEAVLLASGIGLAIIAIQEPLRIGLTALLAPDAQIVELASKYFRIVIWGVPALLATMVISGWFLGMQNTVIPAAIAIATAVANVALSLLAVFPLGLGFPGIAAGTLAANWLGLLLACVAAKRFRSGERKLASLYEMRSAKVLKKFFRVNSDIFLRSACIMTVSMSVTAFGLALGSDTLAANAVMMQFFVLFSYFMDGFAFTGEALVGRYYGAGSRTMLMRAVKYLLLWSAAMAALFFLIYLTAGKYIVAFITDQESVRRTVEGYRIWLLLIPPVTVAAFIFDGFFIGMTATRRMLVATFAALCVFFAVNCLGPTGIGLPDNNNRLWAGFLAYLFTRGFLLAVMSPKVLQCSDS